MTEERLTGKELYERRKRARAERLMRQEEEMLTAEQRAELADEMMMELVGNFGRIAAALERIAAAQEPQIVTRDHDFSPF